MIRGSSTKNIGRSNAPLISGANIVTAGCMPRQVVCGPPKLADDQNETLLNPTLLIEVLSPSTEAHDRGFKFLHYRQLESLQEYALVWQAEPRVEIFRRQPSGEWLLSEAAGL